MLLGDQDAEITHLRHLGDEFVRDLALDRIQLVGGGQHLRAGEVARDPLDHALLGRQLGHASRLGESSVIGVPNTCRSIILLTLALGSRGNSSVNTMDRGFL